MKTSEADFRFPVLGFTPDKQIWGFEDLNTLTSCGRWTLKENMQSGMELIGSDGRRWIVRSIRRVGRAEPLLMWLISHLLSMPQSRIEHELEELAPISLEEIRSRTAASMEAFPTNYCEEDEMDSVFRKLVAKVRAARSVAKIHELLGLDSFMAY
jgi:hypothetical protein